MSFVEVLHVYEDREPHSAAFNMALDEALFATQRLPAIRFYRWRRPSLSFGYFGAFAEVADQMDAREVVRRWTGGGIVFHGSDLTYSVILPRSNGTRPSRSPIVYEEIHRAMQRALAPHLDLELAHADAPKVSASCFANPVAADLLADGQKIAGAAQRRTRTGLLHQGSIQCGSLPADFVDAFASALCPSYEERELSSDVLTRAEELAKTKYGTAEWLRQR